MAIVTESKIAMDDDLESARVTFFVLALDAENPLPLAQRLGVRVEYTIARDDGLTRPGAKEYILSDAISGFQAGDSAALRVLLKKLYDAATAGI